MNIHKMIAIPKIISSMIKQEAELIKISDGIMGHYPEEIKHQAHNLLLDSRSARDNYDKFPNSDAEYRIDRVDWMSYTFLKAVFAFLEDRGDFSNESFKEVCDRA